MSAAEEMLCLTSIPMITLARVLHTLVQYLQTRCNSADATALSLLSFQTRRKYQCSTIVQHVKSRYATTPVELQAALVRDKDTIYCTEQLVVPHLPSSSFEEVHTKIRTERPTVIRVTFHSTLGAAVHFLCTRRVLSPYRHQVSAALSQPKRLHTTV